LGVGDEFIEHGTPEQLRAKCGYDATGIAARVKGMVAKARFKVA
jgi:1-deoxy-D-xylulose-5-phosphate synthase